MNWPGLERWQQLWRAVGASGDATKWYETLTRAYSEPQRHYHNQQHIADCLAEFDPVRRLAVQPDAIELALWFHDAVYDPKATNNEEQSAALVECCLESAGRKDLVETVAALVMATKSHNADLGPEAALIIDVDLSILGQKESRFSEYESQIRAEYSWVSEEVFNAKRAEILQRFLDRKRIYSTEQFFAKYERTARHNLQRSIRNLTHS